VAAIKTFLREKVPGFKDMALTDDEIIRSYILPARNWVQRGKRGGATGGLSFSRSLDQEPNYDNLVKREKSKLKKAAMAAMARISKNGVTSSDDLREMLRVPGYSQWAKSSVAGDVDAAKALRDELSEEYGINWRAPGLNDQGIITFYEGWSGSLDKLIEIADRYDAPIAMRGGHSQIFTPARWAPFKAMGFELYVGAQELLGRPSSVLFSMIRPAGGITTTTPLFSRDDTTGPTPEARAQMGEFSRSQEASPTEPEAWSHWEGRKVDMLVGGRRIKGDAAQIMRDLDDRVSLAQELLDCLG
jgi:hypothetical protein